jgi:hypothetical protein
VFFVVAPGGMPEPLVEQHVASLARLAQLVREE